MSLCFCEPEVPLLPFFDMTLMLDEEIEQSSSPFLETQTYNTTAANCQSSQVRRLMRRMVRKTTGKISVDRGLEVRIV